jgi:acetoin:2,6-dichlorophenolindophenol oxidoreductase subunit alpha
VSSEALKPIDFSSAFDGVPRDVACELYRVMLLIQRVELKIDDLYHEDEMHTPVHLSLGEEAIAAGVIAHLNRHDYIFSNHRGHAHYIAKGGDIKAMIAELYNRATGCSKGRGGSMHLVDTEVGIPGTSSIVAGCVPLATGAGLASSIRKDGRVSVAFFGDAASEEGVVYESIHFAMLKSLPVVFVCENNFYSVCSPLQNRQRFDDIYQKFNGLGIPGHRVDGNNVLDVYRVAGEAVSRARRGEGPSFLECRTYRLRDHSGTGSGAELGYRSQLEVDSWQARCPVKNFENLLIEKNVITSEEVAHFSTEIDQQIADAFAFAKASPLPDKGTVTDYLFA